MSQLPARRKRGYQWRGVRISGDGPRSQRLQPRPTPLLEANLVVYQHLHCYAGGSSIFEQDWQGAALRSPTSKQEMLLSYNTPLRPRCRISSLCDKPNGYYECEEVSRQGRRGLRSVPLIHLVAPLAGEQFIDRQIPVRDPARARYPGFDTYIP
jgi:hypothetical protein